ncbi:MAG: carbohydrate-binding domain-containing protein [Ruminococcus sp.]|nr:carbohydrate-binding domain-containing protein [Ruminococcus sp.]
MEGKKIFAALAAMAVLCSASGCGQTDEISTGDDAPAVSEDLSAVSDTEEESSEADESSSADKKSSDTKEKTTKAGDEKKSGETATTTASSDSKKSGAKVSSGSSSSGNSSSGNGSSGNSSSGNSSSGNSSSGNSSSGNSSSGNTSGGSSSGSTSGGSSTSGGTAPAEPGLASEEDTYTAEITLGGSPSVSGDNVTVDGSTVTVTAGGDYRFTGSLSDGQICIRTAAEEKVKIVLDGVDVACSWGPAVFIDEAKKCTVELAEGSVNVLSDGAKDKINDGVIFSNDTLRIKGNGILEIDSNNAHGIASDDDVIIEGGTYWITSIKSGIFAHDDITINGGDLTIFGGTNGIKSKGTINVNGGTAVISGGTKEEKSSVYAAGAFNYTGGYLYAAGNTVTAPTTSANPYIVAKHSGSAGDSFSLILDGVEQAVLTPHNNYRCVLMLSPEIWDGSSFYANINGSDTVENTVSGTQNVFELD